MKTLKINLLAIWEIICCIIIYYNHNSVPWTTVVCSSNLTETCVAFDPHLSFPPSTLSPKPLVTLILLCTSVSLAFFLDSTYSKITWYWSFCACFTSLRWSGYFRFIDVITNDRISSFLYQKHFKMYVHHTFYPSSDDRYLGRLHILTIVHNSAVSMRCSYRLDMLIQFLWVSTQKWDCWTIW